MKSALWEYYLDRYITWLCSLQIYKLHVTTEQEGRSGESTHLPPMWPEFKSWRRRRMWVEFVVDSLP